ncbi:MAG TPA: small ribosomal subunit Rsm22 family protein, partial [Chthoniobacteraceae bacterium]
REPLLTDQFEVVAPCTHQASCGMLAVKNARHWCHSFATVPPEAFQSAQWSELSREIGIDLRALPYSFLVLQRRGSAAPMATGFSRIIGRPRDYKGYSKILSCQADGVDEFTLQKRDAPALLREVQKDEESLLYRWALEDGKIRAGERLRKDEQD